MGGQTKMLHRVQISSILINLNCSNKMDLTIFSCTCGCKYCDPMSSNSTMVFLAFILLYINICSSATVHYHFSLDCTWIMQWNIVLASHPLYKNYMPWYTGPHIQRVQLQRTSVCNENVSRLQRKPVHNGQILLHLFIRDSVQLLGYVEYLIIAR